MIYDQVFQFAYYFLRIRESLSEPPLKIVVGREDDQHTFYINKAVICSLSGFFEAACKKEWTSGQTNTVTLVEEDPATFVIFLTWVLTKSFDAEELQELMSSDDPNYKEKGQNPLSMRAEQLVPCTSLADQFLCHEFHNAVMDEITRLADLSSKDFKRALLTKPGSVALVCKHTQPPANSKLRLLLTDIGLNVAPSGMETLIKECKGSNPEFLFELLLESHKRYTKMENSKPRLLSKAPCKYHIHPDQAKDYTCKKST